MSDQITCLICGNGTHSIARHLKEDHPGTTLEEYKERFPDAPLISEKVKQFMEKKKREKEAEQVSETTESIKKPLYEVFGFNENDAGMKSTTTGKAIQVSVLDTSHYTTEDEVHIPRVDTDYVMKADVLKIVMFAMETNTPTLIWGMQGTGKTSIIEQVCARTKRPASRIQHSRDTEQSHIVGQWLVKNGETQFELGPLAVAMRRGYVYIADEYDFAMPSVSALYQAVMEGNPLFIKEADEANRVIHPHPNFRFFATGNTNGTGDETGLFQGTMIQNAANYERFGIVLEAQYLPPAAEEVILKNKIGLDDESASKFVRYANVTREAFKSGSISIPMSPRSLLYAAKAGVAFGSYTKGLELAYISRLDSASAQTARESAQRIFK